MVRKFVQNLVKDDSGAVTVDWVVLTAVIVTLGIAVVSVMAPALSSTATEIAVTITTGLT